MGKMGSGSCVPQKPLLPELQRGPAPQGTHGALLPPILGQELGRAGTLCSLLPLDQQQFPFKTPSVSGLCQSCGSLSFPPPEKGWAGAQPALLCLLCPAHPAPPLQASAPSS